MLIQKSLKRYVYVGKSADSQLILLEVATGQAYVSQLAIEEIKKNTRRFAKRQLTWFRRDPDTIWFDFQSDINELIKTIEGKL